MSLRAAVKLLRDQSLVPAQEGLWRHEGRHRFEALPPKRVGERREAPAFRVRQAQPAATEVGFQDAIFRKEIRDSLLLVPLQPAGNHGDQNVEDHSRS